MTTGGLPANIRRQLFALAESQPDPQTYTQEKQRILSGVQVFTTEEIAMFEPDDYPKVFTRPKQMTVLSRIEPCLCKLGEATSSQIANRLKCESASVSHALRKLQYKGKVLCRPGVRPRTNHPVMYWRLADANAQQTA
jgi:hypothetical protein